MANAYSGLKRTRLKKRFDKLKRIQHNNLPHGMFFQFTTLNDLRDPKFYKKNR